MRFEMTPVLRRFHPSSRLFPVITIVFSCCTILALAQLRADDWPEWRGEGRRIRRVLFPSCSQFFGVNPYCGTTFLFTVPAWVKARASLRGVFQFAQAVELTPRQVPWFNRHRQ